MTRVRCSKCGRWTQSKKGICADCQGRKRPEPVTVDTRPSWQREAAHHCRHWGL